MGSPTPTLIGNIIDYIYTMLDTALPASSGYGILLDPDDLTNNPAEILKSGYGVSVEDAQNTEREITGGVYWYRRNFTIVLVRSVLSLYSDAATRKQGIKDVLEDLNLVLQQMKGTRVVTIANVQTAFDFKFVHDSGPRPTQIGDIPYFFIELTISAEYRQT